jgi:hypothetical protein
MPLTMTRLLLVAVALLAMVVVASPAAETRAATAVAADTFNRTVANGWGSAETGGPYTTSGLVSSFKVGSGVGTMILPAASANRAAFLNKLSMRDGEVAFRVRVSSRPVGGPLNVYAELRTNSSNSIRPKLILQPNGTIALQVGVLTAGHETPLGNPSSLGLTYAAGQFIWLRASVTGANRTTVKLKAWLDGEGEPAGWLLTTFADAPSAQVAGAVGLRTYLSASSTGPRLSAAFDNLTVTSSDASPPPPTPTPTPSQPPAGAVLVGAGDIASCTGTGDSQTAALISAISGQVFTAGDNTYQAGTAAEFANCYEPTWGAFKSRTRPVIGNHEYDSSNTAAPYFSYFGTAAGEQGRGWYAYDVGSWRVYVLNTNCHFVDCPAGSLQERWLRADIAANPRKCSIAIWHQPRFSSGSEHGSSPSVQPYWQDAYDLGVDLVINGHDHDYERFAPMNGAGVADPVRGVRELVVGTGGAEMRPMSPTILPNSEVHQATSYGVLKLDLSDGSYNWQFIPVAGHSFTDSGSGACH